ncbi:hypothetical protein QBC32DRAFT_73795 [Pseudoneurospora amorphoporcata]|uniref:NYN domain-containing protein n=1 Tax=Pseudoneurospora amorphoporcata TaxID=241081 RepID=A0AAN6NZC5_9PEZI|nr:hypothetical protein QBC32DRAFT_73795 [Pseudoneurospora amorphoporcata]
MATSFFGRNEPEGRRLGSDLSLIGKWGESYPHRISSLAVPVARLSPADQETLFSKTKCDFRICEQPDMTVKLETITHSKVLEPPNWDDFRKAADPEVVAMMSHPKYAELVRMHDQMSKLVEDSEPEAARIYWAVHNKAKIAGCDLKTADAHAQQAANDHIDRAGHDLKRKWKEQRRAGQRGGALSLKATKRSEKTARYPKTVDEIEAAMVQAVKESKHNSASSDSRKKDLKIDPQATATVKDQRLPTPTTSPTHGSDTSARSARSFLSGSPRSSHSTPSPTLLPKPAITILKRPQPSSETKARNTCGNTASPIPLASVNTPKSAPLPAMGNAAGFAYMTPSGPFIGTPPMYSSGNWVPLASPRPFIYAGNVYYGPVGNGQVRATYTYPWTSPVTSIDANLEENRMDSMTAAKQPEGSAQAAIDTIFQRPENQYQVAESQPYSSITCYEVKHPLSGTVDIHPAYWTTKEDKARLLFDKLSGLRAKDKKVQKEHVSGTNAALSNTVHIFVDLSNIVIGFYDTMKKSRGFSPQKRLKVPFSFKNFDTILTRGRKVEKRVVAGSVSNHSHRRPDYMTEAAELKYEMCILSRVEKPFSSDLRKKSKKYGRRSGGLGDGPESRSEQCVDELLHLKILQSALDVPNPGTMVLATGDAACAEYSDGFKKNTERALARGWKIELYGWKDNIARDWRDPEFTSRWGSRFRIIELDDFCEELLDLTVESVGKSQ